MIFMPLAARLAVVGALVFSPIARPAALWFTVMGEPSSQTADTVELNMDGLKLGERPLRMHARVSLAAQRTMQSGEKFQSYISLMEIDCATGSIVHVHQTRYEGAEWRGPSQFQQFPSNRPMAFAGLHPSPKATILRAACNT